MTVEQAFQVSWNLFQKGIQHKVSKQYGQWNVFVVGGNK